MWKNDTWTMLLMSRTARRLGPEGSDLGMNIKLGWDNANKPVGPAVMNMTTMAGLSPGGGGMAPGGSAGAGVASLMRNTSLAAQSAPAEEQQTAQEGKGSLKKKYAQ